MDVDYIDFSHECFGILPLFNHPKLIHTKQVLGNMMYHITVYMYFPKKN